MILVPELECLKRKVALGNNTYMKIDADFSGSVLFFDTKGNYINGWKYEKGKITCDMNAANENDKLTKRGENSCLFFMEWVGYEESSTGYAYGTLCASGGGSSNNGNNNRGRGNGSDIGNENGGTGGRGGNSGRVNTGNGGGGDGSDKEPIILPPMEDDKPIKVPNGDCVIGTIAEALKRMRKTTPDVTAIRNYIASQKQFGYVPGKGMNSNFIPNALENYFKISTFAYEDEVIAALNKGKLVVGNDLRMKYAVLIFDYRMNQEGRVVYDHYDSVAGRNYNTSLGSNSYQFYIINDLK